MISVSRFGFLVILLAALLWMNVGNNAQAQESGNSSYNYNGINYNSGSAGEDMEPLAIPRSPRQHGPYQHDNCRATMSCGSIGTTISGTTCTSCITCSCTIEHRALDGRWSAATGSPFSNQVCSSATMPSNPTPAQRRICRNAAISGVDALIAGEWAACQARCN